MPWESTIQNRPYQASMWQSQPVVYISTSDRKNNKIENPKSLFIEYNVTEKHLNSNSL